ncbi:hypothetical protein [Cytophaga aurantiaca]|uniref:hypothetical protein n=1 Tax=Cytophaga aurantiaca TaxID=29530 RepID=UPI0012F96459|nr:hypothetical protein [Cytophaga aurantiaca]
MRQLFFILLTVCSLSSQNLYGQKMASDYFDEGEKYAKAQDNKNAIISFQYFVKHYPKNTLYPRAFYNLGYLYFIDKQFDSSIVIFKSILESNFNEKENLGGDIMADPYTNYRHRASEILSEIYYNKKAYGTALHYFALSDTLYPYLHFCGNALEENKLQTALRYADLYQKLDNDDKAIESLLPAVFITLTDNTSVLSELKSLLKKKKNVKKDLDLALTNMYSKTFKREDNYIYQTYYFKFMNAEIEVPSDYNYDEKRKFNQNEAIKEIKQTDFYKMIEEL